MRLITILTLTFQLAFGTALAQTDTSSFYVRVFGSDDVIAPSTPVLTSVTAISADQIDVSWTSATDNFMVSGYVVYRDGTPLATTTLINYSDTGLSASTSYSYFVKAFDSSFNYSSSSNILSAITPNPPVPPTSLGDSGGGTATRVVLDTFIVTPDITAATLSLQTVRPARFEIRWGRSTAYELGYTVNDSFVRSYTTTVTSLEPGTQYYYEVIGYTPFGVATVLKRGTFETLSTEDFLAPANVNGLRASSKGNDVTLRWNPLISEYKYIRVVRNHLRFPTHLEDGVVVYQGKESAITDTEALKEYSPAYYTVFVVDTEGRVSSGAVTRVYYIDGDIDSGGPPIQPPLHNGGVIDGKTPASASTSPHVPAGTLMPNVTEIFIQQSNELQSFASNEITLDAETAFLISIPKAVVSDNLKTIIVSLTDPADSRQAYSFILRINQDNTAYQAALSPLNREGQSRMIIDIYDYESKVVATYQKIITFNRIQKEVSPIFPDLFIKNIRSLVIGIVGIILFSVFIWFFWRRKKQSEDKNGLSRL